MSPRERLEPPVITPLERQLLVGSHEQQRPNIQPVPKSSVLDKLKTFLPQMQQANAELQQKLQASNPTDVDIEHIPDGSNQQIIQMDLACGLLELRDDAAVAAAQRAIAAGGEIAVETYDGGQSSDSDSSDSSDDEDEGTAAAAGGPGGDPGVRDMEGVAEQAAAAAGAAATQSVRTAQPSDAKSSEQQQQQQSGEQQQPQQQRPHGKRRKVKAKRPMIVEL